MAIVNHKGGIKVLKSKIAILGIAMLVLCLPTIALASINVYFSLVDDPEGAIIEELNSAQESIDIAMYYFTYEPIAEAIIRAKNQGVKIRIFMDHYKGSVYQFLLDNGLDNGGPAKQVTADRDKEECNDCKA